VLSKLPEHWKTLYRGRHFHLRCLVRGPRQEAIDRAQDEVRRQGGDVHDFTALSDLSLTLIVELSGERAAALAEALRGPGWDVELEPAPEALLALGAERREGTLLLTFAEGTGELRHVTPAVPG
jgi:hypothetical protein